MTKLDFIDWKRHPVTAAVFSQLQERINILIEELIEQTATASKEAMAEKAGALKAYRDVIQIEYEEESHGN